MSLGTAQGLAAELQAALSGKRIEKIWRPKKGMLSLKISGEARRLLMDTTPAHPHARLCEEWPENPPSPDRVALLLRKYAEGRRIDHVGLLDERVLAFSLRGREGSLELGLQLAGRYPNVSLVGGDGEELVRLIQDRPGRDEASPALKGVEAPFTQEADYLSALSSFAEGVGRRAEAESQLSLYRRAAKALLKRGARALAAIARDLEKAGKAESYRRDGERLKSSLSRAKRGMSSVRVLDWETGEEVEVALDPRLSPTENLKRLFKRYRKFSGARASIEARLKEQDASHSACQKLVSAIEAATEASDEDLIAGLPGFGADLKGLGWKAPRPKNGRGAASAGPPLPYREFRAQDGSLIWLGRSARHNDALTFHHARGHDVWLHARDGPGSHVVLNCSRGSEPSSDALLDAALLAAWHSKLRHEAIIDVMWTRRKHVRKAKGAPAGQVTVSASKTLSVREDPARLERIYTTEVS